MTQVFDVYAGTCPVILTQPHGGTHVPDGVARALNDNGKLLTDTDWHIARLYEGLLPDATVVRSHIHRYVIDANRDPAGHSLYPGQNTTTLVPLTDFDGGAIWRAGHEPSADETGERAQLYHAPYHRAVRNEIERVKAKFGAAIVFDCHSIRSEIAFLFDGKLPVFNTGTNLGASCSALVERAVHDVAAMSGRSAVLNGRFKGGWTTRHYGHPTHAVHAIQMETAQRAYMHEAPPWHFDTEIAAGVRPHLRSMLEKLNELARSGNLN